MKAFLTAFLTAVGVSIATDIDAFSQSRKADPHASYDWALFAARVGKGLIVGSMVWVGVSSATGGQ